MWTSGPDVRDFMSRFKYPGAHYRILPFQPVFQPLVLSPHLPLRTSPAPSAPVRTHPVIMNLFTPLHPRIPPGSRSSRLRACDAGR